MGGISASQFGPIGSAGWLVAWYLLVFLCILVAVTIWAIVLRARNIRLKDGMDTRRADFDQLTTMLKSGALSRDIAGSRIVPNDYRFLEFYLRDNLSDFGARDVSAEKTLAEMCGYADYIRKRARTGSSWNRALAIRSLARLGNPTDVAFFRGVVSRDPHAHCVLAAALGLAACGDVASIPLIVRRLYTPSSPNRDMLLTVLWPFGAAGAPALVEVLESGTIDDTVAAAVVDLVGTLHHRPAKPVLERLLSGTVNPELRVHLIEALEKVGSAETAALLLPYLTDPDFRVRLKAVNAIERVSGARHLDEAEALLDDASYWVRRNAAEAISRMGADGLARLGQLSSSDNARRRTAAKFVLAERAFNRTRWRFRYAESVP